MKAILPILLLLGIFLLPATQAQNFKDWDAFFQKFGPKAEKFLVCMGVDWAKECVLPTITCLAAPNPVSCISLIICEGKSTVECIHYLKDENSTKYPNII